MSIFSRLRRRGDEGSAELRRTRRRAHPTRKHQPHHRPRQLPVRPNRRSRRSRRRPRRPRRPRASRRARPVESASARQRQFPGAGAIARAVPLARSRSPRQGSRFALGQGLALPRRDTARRRAGRARAPVAVAGPGGRVAGSASRSAASRWRERRRRKSRRRGPPGSRGRDGPALPTRPPCARRSRISRSRTSRRSAAR